MGGEKGVGRGGPAAMNIVRESERSMDEEDEANGMVEDEHED